MTFKKQTKNYKSNLNRVICIAQLSSHPPKRLVNECTSQQLENKMKILILFFFLILELQLLQGTLVLFIYLFINIGRNID